MKSKRRERELSMSDEKKTRHVCGISGGKDSAALAIYMKQQNRVPDMEYYFSDTGCELPETYHFIDRLEAYLGKEITHLGDKGTFEHNLNLMSDTFENHLEKVRVAKLIGEEPEDIRILPSATNRWCTVKMKLEPFEKFIGNDEVMSYVAIRADEHRDGYISTKPNIHPVFPFIHDEIIRKDVFRILEETVGIPEYYKWRSRSGCYFCFFQRREEWIGLYDNHPQLFKKAMKMEKFDPATGKGFTWVEGEDLASLLNRRDEIISEAEKRRGVKDNRTWQQKLIEDGQDDDFEDQTCLICSL